MSHKDTVVELCNKAGVGRPFVYSSWVFMRATGEDKTEAANMIGCGRNTLTRYEDRVRENLDHADRFKLLHVAFNHEYEERIGDGDD